MKVTLNRIKLADILTPMMGCTGTPSAIPALACIHVVAEGGNSICLTTTDATKTYRCHVDGLVNEPGACLLPAAKMLAVAKAMDSDNLVIAVDAALKVNVTGGSSVHTFAALPAEMFPVFPVKYTDDSTDTAKLTASTDFSVNRMLLKNAINSAAYAMAANDARVVLNGVYLSLDSNTGTLTTVACDGFRLAVVKRQANVAIAGRDKVGYVLANKSVKELLKVLDTKDENATVRILASAKHIAFCLADTVFVSILLSGEYINYERIIPGASTVTTVVNKVALDGVLTRAGLVANDQTAGKVIAPVVLSIDGNTLTATTQNVNGTAVDELEVVHEGADLRIGFNNKLLQETLRACGDVDKVKIGMTNAHGIAVLEPLDDTAQPTGDKFLVLPIRLHD